MALDLFVVKPPATWGVIMLLRTGPADYSHRFVKLRMDGGAMPFGWRVADGQLWRGSTPLSTPEEADVYAALDLPWIAPEERA